MRQFIPSKSALKRSRRLLDFSERGYKLLDRKKTVLLREYVLQSEVAKTAAEELEQAMGDAREALKRANMTQGRADVEALSLAAPVEDSLRLYYTSAMGVELPHILSDLAPKEPRYGLFRSNLLFDVARDKALKLREPLLRYLEAEAACRRLAKAIEATARRANSIEKIQIPRYSGEVKRITDALEEKDREEQARVKVLKKHLNRD